MLQVRRPAHFVANYSKLVLTMLSQIKAEVRFDATILFLFHRLHFLRPFTFCFLIASLKNVAEFFYFIIYIIEKT
jgi:hypothetical protein